jgi:hypothetical protein
VPVKQRRAIPHPEPFSKQETGLFISSVNMQEKTITRNGQKITEVRSDAGKLLYIKTREGYELKCPRSKQICLVSYEQMLEDCSSCLEDNEKDKGPVRKKGIK